VKVARAPAATTRSLFAQEFSRLELGAKVRSYLTVLTASNVPAMGVTSFDCSNLPVQQGENRGALTVTVSIPAANSRARRASSGT